MKKEIIIDAHFPGENYRQEDLPQVYRENPYYILGLACTAKRGDVTDAVNQMEMLEDLGSAQDYNAPLVIDGIESPVRSIATFHAAAGKTEDPVSKWFWFSGKTSPASWNLDEEDGQLSFDWFVGFYLRVTVDAKRGRGREKFRELICLLNGLLTAEDSGLYPFLAAHMNEEDIKAYGKDEALKSFRSNVCAPLLEMIQKADDSGLAYLTGSLDQNTFLYSHYLKETFEKKLLGWADDVTADLKKLSADVRADSISQEQADAISKAYDDFRTVHLDTFNKVVSSLPCSSFKTKFYNSVCKVIDSARYTLRKIRPSKEAQMCGDIIRYFNGADAIRRDDAVYLDIPETEFNRKELRERADYFKQQKNPEKAEQAEMELVWKGDIEEAFHLFTQAQSKRTGTSKGWL